MKNRAAEIHAGLKHPVIDGDGHWLEPVRVSRVLVRSGRRSNSQPHKSALAAQSRVVPLHLVAAPAQSHPAQRLVGRHQQDPRQGNGAAAGPDERTAAGAGHRLRVDLSEPRARAERHCPR